MKRKEKQTGVESLHVFRNFRKVIEKRDMGHMGNELYDFLNLNCGFIAHNNINGFKAVYSAPNDFAQVFISHFDKDHRYFSRIYPCDARPYKETGYTIAQIKGGFCRLVEKHKKAIRSWAEKKGRQERFEFYLILKEEFEPANGIGEINNPENGICGTNPAANS